MNTSLETVNGTASRTSSVAAEVSEVSKTLQRNSEQLRADVDAFVKRLTSND